MTRGQFRLVWNRVKQEFQTNVFPVNVWLFLLLTNHRPQASRTNRTGSSTSGRWFRSAPFTWEEHSRSPFTFPKPLQPSTTRAEGKHVTPTVLLKMFEMQSDLFWSNPSHTHTEVLSRSLSETLTQLVNPFFVCLLGMERTWTVRVKAAANQTPSLWHPALHRTHWTATR